MLISNFIVFREKVLYSFKLLKFLKLIHYLDYGLSLKWNHMFFKRICILLSIYSILFYIMNGKSGWLMLLFSSMICWIFVKKFFVSVAERSIEVSSYNCRTVCFLFQLWQFLFQLFWGFVANCCIFLMNWPLYETSFFGFSNISHLKVCFVSYYCNLSSSCMVIVLMAYIWSSLYFDLHL